MSAEVFEDVKTVYYAYCDECDWGGEDYLDEGDAMREMEWHNESCDYDEDGEPDHRTEREKFQDRMDTLVEVMRRAFP